MNETWGSISLKDRSWSEFAIRTPFGKPHVRSPEKEAKALLENEILAVRVDYLTAEEGRAFVAGCTTPSAKRAPSPWYLSALVAPTTPWCSRAATSSTSAVSCMVHWEFVQFVQFVLSFAHDSMCKPKRLSVREPLHTVARPTANSYIESPQKF